VPRRPVPVPALPASLMTADVVRFFSDYFDNVEPVEVNDEDFEIDGNDYVDHDED
jgi:hypothetical protein